ncbi:MAG TPA: hypothetical protein DCS19_01335 [Flavobacterium sp.]|nr:hypothetical protein [Flavobacterium sp.]
MARILDIQKKSNQYLSNFTANVVRVIEGNKDEILDVNRSQMLNSKDADDKQLIHSRTGRSTLSKQYARRMGKTYPNLFVSGAFQGKMIFTMPSEKEYFISSKDYKTKWLAGAYGKIFGVAPNNQPKTQKINDSAIINDYLQIFKT